MQPNPFMFAANLNRMAILPKPEMPATIQILFAARPPLTQIKPPPKNKCRKLDGIINSYKNYIDLFEETDPPEREEYVPPRERRERLHKAKIEEHKAKNKELATSWNPKEDPHAESDPLKTLFVSRLSYETTEETLRKEFELYGPIKSIKMVRTPEGKSRGYAFIEFEDKNDFVRAYKRSDGRKIDGRRIVVDYEKGRTVPGWLPRRLGGGKGETRKKQEAGIEKRMKAQEKRRARAERRAEAEAREEEEERQRMRAERGGRGGFRGRGGRGRGGGEDRGGFHRGGEDRGYNRGGDRGDDRGFNRDRGDDRGFNRDRGDDHRGDRGGFNRDERGNRDNRDDRGERGGYNREERVDRGDKERLREDFHNRYYKDKGKEDERDRERERRDRERDREKEREREHDRERAREKEKERERERERERGKDRRRDEERDEERRAKREDREKERDDRGHKGGLEAGQVDDGAESEGEVADRKKKKAKKEKKEKKEKKSKSKKSKDKKKDKRRDDDDSGDDSDDGK